MKKTLTLLLMLTTLIIVSGCNGFLSFRTYQVSFETNGGTELDPILVEIGLSIDFSNVTTTKEGYVFEGWYLENSFVNEITDEYLVYANIMIYAKWSLDMIVIDNVNYELNGSNLSWDDIGLSYDVYINEELIDTSNENVFDLSTVQVMFLEERHLSVRTLDEDEVTLLSILNLMITYEENSILFNTMFSRSNEYLPIALIRDYEHEINDYTIINSNFVRDSGTDALKLIFNRNNEKVSSAHVNINNEDNNVYSKLVLNAKTQSLNELIIKLSYEGNLIYEEQITLGTNYEDAIILLPDLIHDNFDITLILVPSVLESNNSGVFITSLSLLSNDQIYRIK